MWYLELSNDDDTRVMIDTIHVLRIEMSNREDEDNFIYITFDDPVEKRTINIDYSDHQAFERDRNKILTCSSLFYEGDKNPPYARFDVEEDDGHIITEIIKLVDVMYIECTEERDLSDIDPNHRLYKINILYGTNQRIVMLTRNKDFYQMIIDSRYRRYLDEED